MKRPTTRGPSRKSSTGRQGPPPQGPSARQGSPAKGPPGRPGRGADTRGTSDRGAIAGPPLDGEIVFGLRAGLAVLAAREGDILRVAHDRDVRSEITELARHCVARSIPLVEMSPGELARIAETTHHEGLVVMTRPRKWVSLAALGDRLVASRGVAIALDRVRNPYNIGAILRTAAFLGIDAAILGSIAPHPALPADAVRVSEGGAEHLPLARTTDLADTLGRLRARGVKVLGADGAADTGAIGLRIDRPVVIVVGHEREGISDRVRAQCDRLIAIRGTGTIESLNVAVASGLLMSEALRAR